MTDLTIIVRSHSPSPALCLLSKLQQVLSNLSIKSTADPPAFQSVLFYVTCSLLLGILLDGEV